MVLHDFRGRVQSIFEHYLLNETQEDGNYDGGFEGFTKDDEEDGDAEEVWSHCGGERQVLAL